MFVFAFDGYYSEEMCWLRCISLARRNMFNDIIVWATVRACFKLLISSICQAVKVVCVGWVSNSSCWLMKHTHTHKKIMLRGWEPRKVGCGWYNGPIMIWDVALKRKKGTLGTRSGNLFISLSCLVSYWWTHMHNIFYEICLRKIQTICNTYNIPLTQQYGLAKKYTVSNIQNAVKMKQIELRLWLLPSGNVTGAVPPCLLHFTPLKSGYIQVQTPVEWRIEHMAYSCRKCLKCKTQTQHSFAQFQSEISGYDSDSSHQSQSDAPPSVCLLQEVRQL